MFGTLILPAHSSRRTSVVPTVDTPRCFPVRALALATLGPPPAVPFLRTRPSRTTFSTDRHAPFWGRWTRSRTSKVSEIYPWRLQTRGCLSAETFLCAARARPCNLIKDSEALRGLSIGTRLN